MYIRQYGLERNPFKNAPGSTLFYTSYNHKGVLDSLVEGIRGRYGLHLVAGENGTGKTTLARFLQMAYAHEFTMAYLGNPFVTDIEFLNHVLESFGGGPLPDASPKVLVDALCGLLAAQSKGERIFVLLVDEAHHLSRDIFDHLLVLSNQHHSSVPMMQIALLGLPSLLEILAEPRFGSLNQRIGSRNFVHPMNLEETGKYIGYRLTKAGCRKQYLFDGRAIKCIFKVTGGKPRLINHLCSLALEEGARQTRSIIDAKVVRAVLKDPAYTSLFFPDSAGQGLKKQASPVDRRLTVVTGLLLAMLLAGGTYITTRHFETEALQQNVAPAEQFEKITIPKPSKPGPSPAPALPFWADLEIPEPIFEEPRIELPEKFPVSTGKALKQTPKPPQGVSLKPTDPRKSAPASAPKPVPEPKTVVTKVVQREIIAPTKNQADVGPHSIVPENETLEQQTALAPQAAAPVFQNPVPAAPEPAPLGTTAAVPVGERPNLPKLPSEFAEVHLNALVWDENPARRMAVINSQILYEKSMFGRLTVLNIGKGYVILGHADQRYLLEPNTR